VRAEDHVVEAEHLVGGPEVQLHRVLADAVGVLGLGHHRLVHRQLAGAVHGDRRREHEALHLVPHRLVDQVDAPDQVVGVVEAADEVRQPLGGVGGEVVDVVELVLGEEAGEQRVVGDAPFHEQCPFRDLVTEAAAQVVEDHDLVTQPEALLRDVGSDEPGTARYQ
jgi:hypothetical protein